MKCSFCGFEFDPTAREACPSCPLSANCGRVCCPRCGYEALRPSPLVDAVRRWFRGSRRPAEHPGDPSGLSLADLAIGQEAAVVGVDSDRSASQVGRLLAMGLLPGATVRLMRRSPAYVFQIGNSQFAVDREIACRILVRTRREEP
jgi:Fe2+ transport system protein FeoA